MRALRLVGSPSPSKGRERSPRGRTGSSMIVIPSGNIRLPSESRRKLDLRVMAAPVMPPRSEEHTSELQSLMRISYAVFCLKKKTQIQKTPDNTNSRHTQKIIQHRITEYTRT